MSMAETAKTKRSAEAPVLLRRDEAAVTWLTLNRPAQRNALSIELMAVLQREFDAIAKEPATKVVVIAGAVGRKAAMEMLLTGDLVDADRARELGLVNRVVPQAKLDAEVTALARQIAGKSALTVRIGKEAFYGQAELPLADAYAYASE